MTDSKPGKIYVGEVEGACVLRMVGDIRVVLCTSIDDYIESIFSGAKEYHAIIVDVTEAVAIDSTTLGVLAKIALYAKEKFNLIPSIFSNDESISLLLTRVGFDQLFNIVTNPEKPLDCESWCELQPAGPQGAESEEKVRKMVIQAHKLLMSLNETNRQEFSDLVEKLEAEE